VDHIGDVTTSSLSVEDNRSDQTNDSKNDIYLTPSWSLFLLLSILILIIWLIYLFL